MTRALGLCGFAGVFLLISPQLREAVVDRAGSSITLMHQYSPYSYVGLVLVILGGATVTLVSGSTPR